ncbi:MAG: ATP-binding cassette domain-containing protein, partial [Gammaproteobacteria bacterium]
AFPNRLSGGMQRRAALARAFVINPGLLLMDEPFVSLDDPLAWRLRNVLLDLWQRSRPTIMYVTHDLREAITLADRVLFLSARPGRVILERTISLPRPRVPNSETIDRMYRELLCEYPQLLSGAVGSDDARDGAFQDNR